jgi:hypothetical protein
VTADNPVLEWALAKVDASGGRAVFHVRVGPPRYGETPFPAWRCGFTIEGHFERETTVIGVTALQALGLALKVVRAILRDIAEEATLVELESEQALNEDLLVDAIH